MKPNTQLIVISVIISVISSVLLTNILLSTKGSPLFSSASIEMTGRWLPPIPKPVPISGALSELELFNTNTLFSKDGRLDPVVVNSFLDLVNRAVAQKGFNKATAAAQQSLGKLLSVNSLPKNLPACWKERTKWDVAVNINAIVASSETLKAVTTAKNEFNSRCASGGKKAPDTELLEE